MLPLAEWDAIRRSAEYRAPSLESEGFIHCTCGERNMVEVANLFYRERPGEWAVLVLDPGRIRSEVRWESQPNGLAYPHIYGPLNLDAVSEVRRFRRDADGTFLAFRDEAAI